MKKGSGKILEGALIGAALGVAAGFLLAPESGKKLRRDLKKRSAEFYKYLAPQLKKYRKMGEQEYKELVRKAAHQYAKSRNISRKEAEALVKEAHKSWKHFKKHLRK